MTAAPTNQRRCVSDFFNFRKSSTFFFNFNFKLQTSSLFFPSHAVFRFTKHPIQPRPEGFLSIDHLSLSFTPSANDDNNNNATSPGHVGVAHPRLHKTATPIRHIAPRHYRSLPTAKRPFRRFIDIFVVRKPFHPGRREQYVEDPEFQEICQQPWGDTE